MLPRVQIGIVGKASGYDDTRCIVGLIVVSRRCWHVGNGKGIDIVSARLFMLKHDRRRQVYTLDGKAAKRLWNDDFYNLVFYEIIVVKRNVGKEPDIGIKPLERCPERLTLAAKTRVEVTHLGVSGKNAAARNIFVHRRIAANTR